MVACLSCLWWYFVSVISLIFFFFFNFYHNIFLLVMLHLVSVFGIGRLIFVAGDLFTILFMLILLLS